MTPRDHALWMRLNRKAAGLAPEVASEILDALQVIQDALSDAELARLIESGQLDQWIDDALTKRAFQSVRDRIIANVKAGFHSAIPDLPHDGKIDGVLATAFDTLNPKVIDAVRALDSRVINTLSSDIRDTVRAFVENGLRDGISTRQIAKQVRGLIGLSPAQAQFVQNYRAELEAGSKAALDRRLRDRRFDGIVTRGDLTPERIDRMVVAYEKRVVQFNANTNAQTIARDSLKLGQHLSWQDAIDQGLLTKEQVVRKWVTVGDDRVRPEHQAMEGQTASFDGPFSNGEYIPGESTYGCRCVVRFIILSQAQALAA